MAATATKKTRTRKGASVPATASKAGRAKAAKAASSSKAAKKTGPSDAQKARQEGLAKAREEKAALKATERQALVESGDLIENEDGTEYVFAAEIKKETVTERAEQVLDYLKANGTEVPVLGKELADNMGGGTVQWVAFFGMLKTLGLVKPYRYHGGERGKSGMAYLWVGDSE